MEYMTITEVTFRRDCPRVTGAGAIAGPAPSNHSPWEMRRELVALAERYHATLDQPEIRRLVGPDTGRDEVAGLIALAEELMVQAEYLTHKNGRGRGGGAYFLLHRLAALS